jgi:hypothetical protein
MKACSKAVLFWFHLVFLLFIIGPKHINLQLTNKSETEAARL